MYQMMTPGPTMPAASVMEARSRAFANPDVDETFCEEYHQVCKDLSNLLGTDNETYVLGGEGILALEAACATLTEPGDKVLVIDNGIFGKGFDDFVKMYGGEVVYFSDDYNKEIDVDKLEKFLEKDHDFKYATVVHCDTPTGVLNDLSKICPLLKKYNILTVVDSVAAMVGENIEVDNWQLDIVCGGSQKAISAPTGLTMVSVSEDAKNAMKNRKTPIIGFYCNLTIWENYYRDKWFPYTMPISDIMGLDVALDNILEEGLENVHNRHAKVANATRKAVKEYGLNLFLENGYSNTVTAICIDEEIGAGNLVKHLLEKYNLVMTTSLNQYTGKILRIGHMGENAKYEAIVPVLNYIDLGLKDLGFKTDKNLVELFNKYYNA